MPKAKKPSTKASLGAKQKPKPAKEPQSPYSPIWPSASISQPPNGVFGGEPQKLALAPGSPPFVWVPASTSSKAEASVGTLASNLATTGDPHMPAPGGVYLPPFPALTFPQPPSGSAPFDQGDDGPVSSRTRHGAKAKSEASGPPAQGVFPPDAPPVWAFAPPETFGPGITQADMEAVMDDGNNFVSHYMLGDDDDWASFPVKKKPKKQLAAEKRAATMKIRKECKLYRPGDSELVDLRLPNDDASYADLRTSTERDPTLTEQQDVQRFMSCGANTLLCKCGQPLAATAVEVVRLARSWLDVKPSNSPTYLARCPMCDAATCVLCRATDATTKHKCTKSTDGKQVAPCFVVWILLCGLDESIKPALAAVKSNKRVRNGNKKSTSAWAPGIGYGGSGSEGWSDSSESLDVPVEAMSDTEQKYVEKALSDLAKHLPNVLEQSSITSLVVPMLRESRLQLAMARLLDNESLHDVSVNTSLYQPLLKILETFLAHDATQTFVLDMLPVSTSKESLLHWTYAVTKAAPQASAPKNRRSSSRASSSSGETVTRESLISSLRRFDATCQVFEATVDRNSKLASDKGTKEMLAVCKLIQDVLAQAQRTSGIHLDAEEEETEKVDTEHDWFKEHCLLDVDDGTICAEETNQQRYHFSYSSNPAVRPKPGRMKHLLTEMIMLKNSLPPGIFVRHESSRLDIIKALIIGPKGTPYENGAFEFDILCTANYPNNPPMVQFKQTGGGSESMNPNLYPDGKVCLSLLGTWQGTPWQPGKSTILQVLLSLQGMVFCDEPYYNEPGWSSTKNDKQSQSYNRNLYRATTRVAILQWLDEIEERHNGKRKDKEATDDGSELWDEVLTHHFVTNADNIVKTIKSWDDLIIKEHEERAAAAKLAVEAANNNASDNAASVLPPAMPPPIGTGWSHYQIGKSLLTDMIPRVAKALESLKARAAAANAEASVSVPASKAHRAIKSPAELTKKNVHFEEEEDVEEGSRETRSKRRKTGATTDVGCSTC